VQAVLSRVVALTLGIERQVHCFITFYCRPIHIVGANQ